MEQAKPALEIRRLAVDGGTPTVYVQDGDWALYTGTWNECISYVEGFEKAWGVKTGPEPDPFTEAMQRAEDEGKVVTPEGGVQVIVLDAWQTYLLEDR
jgi:hypothetical protein